MNIVLACCCCRYIRNEYSGWKNERVYNGWHRKVPQMRSLSPKAEIWYNGWPKCTITAVQADSG